MQDIRTKHAGRILEGPQVVSEKVGKFKTGVAKEKQLKRMEKEKGIKVKVSRHRTKKDIITINAILPIADDQKNIVRLIDKEGSKAVIQIKDGYLIQGKQGSKNTGHNPINLKLTLSEDDLFRLSFYVNAHGKEHDLGDLISSVLVDSVLQLKKGARGLHKGRAGKVSLIKLEASLLYVLFSELCKKPERRWPSYFKRLINDFRRNDLEGNFDPVILTAYCLENHYKGYRESVLGLKPFFSVSEDTNDFNLFHTKYIKPKLKMAEGMIESLKKNIRKNIKKNIRRRSGDIIKLFYI